MSTHSASLPKRPHSPSPSSNSPPAKRRAQSPEEGELDDSKPARTQSPSSSPSLSRDDTPGAGGTGGTRSTSPSEPSLGTKNSKHAFPFSTRDQDRDRKRDRGDFYRPSSSPRRHNHNHSGMFDSYRPDDNDHGRPTRSRSRSRSRVDSNSPVARRHRLPPRPASPPPQPPLHSSFERNGYDRNGGAPGYGNERNSAPGVYDRWQPPTSSSSSSYVNGRGRELGPTRNPYAESAPRGSTPNGNGPGGLRPLDTPGAPMAGERVGIEEGRVESWEPRPDRDRGRQFGREWDRERGRDDSRGWDRDRGKNRVPLATIPPNPPQVPVDPKITDTLNDTIARIEREADEADAKKGAGGEGKESKEASGGGKPKVLRRTAEQEMQAYGRKFVGTSQLKDYAISEKLGEGTFGEVHKATHIVSKRVVALKRILMHNEKEGVPVTALREIKILKMLSHPSVVPVCDMVVEAATRDRKGSLYMVFPYMDHDLAGLLENPAVKFSPSQIKLYMRQLLEGTEYLHRNKILHRDLKAANLLINNNGSLQIADFGLARPYSTSNPGWDARGDAAEWDALKGGVERGGGGARYTNCVVTRWYRPPELLMGEARYGCAIDLWGVGCIMGEMWTRRPILCGNSDADQLEKIWELCGTPDDVIWPGWRELPGMDGVKPGFRTKLTSRVKQFFAAQTSMDEHGVDLIVKLLTLNPAARITAFEALDHDYFWTEPLPCDPSSYVISLSVLLMSVVDTSKPTEI
ncbi:serine/threonine protein kinase, CMGC, CDC2/CDK sub [Ceratobasidium sp. UAMH 11750]|nr:serine/threonine protein kinase, CMGC, CDC2/CDK sub [Ceratobasidium sp. UAMH 11750]